MMDATALKEYLDRNYGRCKLKNCLCRSQHAPRFGGEWVGKICPDWIPTGATTWEELRQHALKEKQDGLD